MTYCSACKTSFAGTQAFDRHRVGNHAFDYDPNGPTIADAFAYLGVTKLSEWEAAFHKATPTKRRELRLPASVKGRRCMDEDEMRDSGMEPNEKGEWRITPSEADIERLRKLQAA